jgi:hypothetical protein
MDKSDVYARDLSGVTWRKSSKSFPDGQECVEVAELGDGAVALRDPTTPHGRPSASLPQNGRRSCTGSTTASSDRCCYSSANF